MHTSPVSKKILDQEKLRTIESMNYEILTESIIRPEADSGLPDCLAICEMKFNDDEVDDAESMNAASND